ncbi:Neprosin, partial [Dillenia turbinata]
NVPPEISKWRLNNDQYTKKVERNGSEVVYGAWQTWHGGGEGCPDGTIPIRRCTTHDVLSAKCLYDVGKKPRRSPALLHSLAPDAVTTDGHETNNKIAVGAAISPVSLLSGSQYGISIRIWKNPKIGNWWLRFGDNT